MNVVLHPLSPPMPAYFLFPLSAASSSFNLLRLVKIPHYRCLHPDYIVLTLRLNVSLSFASLGKICVDGSRDFRGDGKKRQVSWHERDDSKKGNKRTGTHERAATSERHPGRTAILVKKILAVSVDVESLEREQKTNRPNPTPSRPHLNHAR